MIVFEFFAEMSVMAVFCANQEDKFNNCVSDAKSLWKGKVLVSTHQMHCLKFDVKSLIVVNSNQWLQSMQYYQTTSNDDCT